MTDDSVKFEEKELSEQELMARLIPHTPWICFYLVCFFLIILGWRYAELSHDEAMARIGVQLKCQDLLTLPPTSYITEDQKGKNL